MAFYSVDEQTIEQVDIPKLPTGLTQTLDYSSVDRGSQVHSAMRGKTGKQSAVFHGQGGQPDSAKDDRRAYCAQINNVVSNWLGQSTRPMLLACVEPLGVIYRQENTYTHLLDETLFGNQDHASAHELHAGAVRKVQPLLKSKATIVAARYANLSGTERVTDDPCEIVIAAAGGRVESLLYEPKAELFGAYDQTAPCVEITGSVDDDDLVDRAAMETLRNGGTIHSMANREDLLTNSPLAAILRY